MKHAEDIIRHIVEDSRLDYCAICGKCIAKCPTYRELSLELHSPRGRLNLIKAFIDGDLPSVGVKFYESLDWCLLCGACNSACPAGIRPADAIMYARGLPEFTRRQSRIEKFVLGNIVSRQEILSALAFPLRIADRLGLIAVARHPSISRLLPQSLNNLQTLLPRRLESSFSRREREIHLTRILENEEPSSPLRIRYFVGCAMNMLFPTIALDTVNLLQHAGCSVRTPSHLYCCGAPHIHEGDIESAVRLAQTNVELLDDSDIDIITSDCDSCTATIKHYRTLLKETEWEDMARRVSDKCISLTELYIILNVTSWDFEDFGNIRITWDDPCELLHAQGVSRAPRQILQSLPGVKFTELPESDWCCGCAGAYVIKHPVLSRSILSRKIQMLEKVKADVLVTSNPGCILQIARGIEDANLATRVQHISSLLMSHVKNVRTITREHNLAASRQH